MAHCLNRIRAEGYEVSLVLEATIGFSKSGTREPALAEQPLDPGRAKSPAKKADDDYSKGQAGSIHPKDHAVLNSSRRAPGNGLGGCPAQLGHDSAWAWGEFRTVSRPTL